MKNRFLALVGGIFHRNEKIQKTKVIYFMFGTYCWLGVPKIQKVQIITPPITRKDLVSPLQPCIYSELEIGNRNTF